MARHPGRRGPVGVVVAVALALGGCAADEPGYDVALAGRLGAVAGAYDPWPASVLGAMPAATRGSGGAGVSDAVVLGRFTGWEIAERRQHPTARGRINGGTSRPANDIYSHGVVLELTVDEVIDRADDVRVGATERVFLSVVGDGSLERVSEELVALDEVVVYLSPAPHTDRTGWVVSLDWSLLGEVDADGGITWPVLERAAEEGTRLDAGSVPLLATLPVDIRHLDDLRSAAG